MSRTHLMAYTRPKRADADSPWICDAITVADADRPRILRCGRGLSADAKCADPHTSGPIAYSLIPMIGHLELRNYELRLINRVRIRLRDFTEQ